MTDPDDFSPATNQAMSVMPNARAIVIRHLRQMAAGEGRYDGMLDSLPYHARQFLLAAAEIIEEDSRRLG